MAPRIGQQNVIPAKAGIHASFRSRDADAGHRRRPRARRLFASVALAAATLLLPMSAGAQLKPDTAGIETQTIEVRARPIASFSRGATSGTAAAASPARLEWRGGLVLSSPSSQFGGWSGLALAEDGSSFVAVSDSGVWMRGEIAYDGIRPQALRAVQLGALRNLKGGPLKKMRERDAEAITLASGTPFHGTAYIAFEQADRIGVFPIDRKNGLGQPASYLTMPKEAARMRLDGIEGLAVLAGGPRKGALVAFAENPLRGESAHRGWIWLGGKPHGFTLPGIGGYGITDAASLPDGSVLILERRFRWLEGLRVRLRRLAPDGIRPGGAATGEILLEANNTTSDIDNLEALAVSTGGDGETVVTLMSDDNYNRFLQRTLLLQFTLKDEAMAEATGAAPAKAPAARP